MDDCSIVTVRSSPGSTLSFIPATPDDRNYDDAACTTTLKYPQSTNMKELRFNIEKTSQTFRYLVRPRRGTIRAGEDVDVNIIISEKDKRALFGPSAEGSALRKFRHEMADSLIVTWETPDGRDVTHHPTKDAIYFRPLAHGYPASVNITLRHPETDASSSKNYIAFKIMTNQSRHYNIRPAHGIMKPGSLKTIQITLIEKENENILDSLEQEKSMLDYFKNDKIAILSQPVSDASFAKRIFTETSKYEAMVIAGAKTSNLLMARKELFRAFITGWDTMAESYPQAVSKHKISLKHTVALNPSDRYPTKEYPNVDVVLKDLNQQQADGPLVHKKTRRRPRNVGKPYNRVK